MCLIKENFEIILRYANKYNPRKHNSKYSNRYYLEHILDVLEDAVTWKSLKKFRNVCNKHTYHYKTINKKHLEWSKNNVYEDAYKYILKTKKRYDITPNNFIDGTLIINKSGIENIGFGCGESLKKKYTSITCVCNENMIPISVVCNKNYDKIINENIIIKTLPHDSKSILPSIKYINTNKKYNLIGDAGFIIDAKNIPDNVNLITAKRKNQKIKNNDYNKQQLKQRHIIENLFAKIKRFNRVHVRRDKLCVTYLGFVYLSFIAII